MIATRRRPFPIGGSKAVTLPGGMVIGNEVSMSAGDRLLIMDTSGEIPERKLLEFLTQYVEPVLLRWWESQRPQPTPEPGVFTVQQAQSEHTPTETRMLMPTGFLPGVPIYDVTCPSCRNRFHWDMGRGEKGFCPFCGIYLWFRP